MSIEEEQVKHVRQWYIFASRSVIKHAYLSSKDNSFGTARKDIDWAESNIYKNDLLDMLMVRYAQAWFCAAQHPPVNLSESETLMHAHTKELADKIEKEIQQDKDKAWSELRKEK